MASQNISTQAGRARLKPRREPYFTKVAKGQHLGFRRLEAGGTWVARFQTGAVKQYRALGPESLLPEYKDALREALKWFDGQTSEDRPDQALTVSGAITAYLCDLKTRKSIKASKWAEAVARRHILPKLGKVEVARLTTRRIKVWRDGLVRTGDDAEAVRKSKDTANRNLGVLKAALNLVFQEGGAVSDASWRRVDPFKHVGRARDVFLTQAQCAALLKASERDFSTLVRSGLLTGARYGELTRTTVADFDPVLGTIHIADGKTGSREIVLSDAGVAHFKALTKSRLPAALLHYREEAAKHPDTGKPMVKLVKWGESDQTRRIKAAVAAANKTIGKPADRLPAATCFYSLRHTHASLALLAGVNIQVLAENMGTSVRMIEKHYGKFLRADRRAMFNAMPAIAS